jgi:NAD(P)-dependent dehydrogenase (short-subunit alcohol dehydrogenase family)
LRLAQRSNGVQTDESFLVLFFKKEPLALTLSVVIGATGGLGTALAEALVSRGDHVVALGRATTPPLDLLDEASIASAAAHVAAEGTPRLVIDATGFLHGGGFMPERSWRDIDPAHMAHAFAVNAIGPALLMKHFLPLLPREGPSVFATLSARVGSIGDNRLGGWYAYRASKAALNQLVRTASVELRRRAPAAVCVALHPGTVATALSDPFARAGLDVRPPEVAAADLLRVIADLQPADNGSFLDHRGAGVPW